MFRWFASKPVPLSGAPEVRRLKSHSAQSGYVYQYCYEGQRPIERPAATEYVFRTTADRKTWHDVSVHVEGAAIAAWESARGRTLSAPERYAVAKVALFTAFDERATPADVFATPARVRAADLEAIVERLGLEE